MRVEQEEWHLSQNGADSRATTTARSPSVRRRAALPLQPEARLHQGDPRARGRQARGRNGLAARGRLRGQARSVRRRRAQPRRVHRQRSRGATLALRWGPEAGQTLVRRTPTGGQLRRWAAARERCEPRRAAGVDERGRRSRRRHRGSGSCARSTPTATSASSAKSGTWPRGPDGVHGYYDRTVKRVRGDGVLTCNGQSRRFETATRYTVVGQRFGEKLRLTEVDYKATAQPRATTRSAASTATRATRRRREPGPVVGSGQSAPPPQALSLYSKPFRLLPVASAYNRSLRCAPCGT